MNVFLMHNDHDFNAKLNLPLNENAIVQDLELHTLINSMSLGDTFIFDVSKNTLLTGLYNNIDTILYRQNILKDCLRNSSIIRNIYKISGEANEYKKNSYFSIFNKFPSSILNTSLGLLRMFLDALYRLRNIADDNSNNFNSNGFINFFNMLKIEFNDDYLSYVKNILLELEFKKGTLISSQLGDGNKGINYILRKPIYSKKGLINRIFSKNPPVYTFSINDRDISVLKALTELRDRGIHLVANVLAQSIEHILSFFNMLRTELAFYIGCLNLYDIFSIKSVPTSFPIPVDYCNRKHSFRGLHDPCLALILDKAIVGNDMNADNIDIVIITGANQGGKSTFLRSIGLSQLMMQCGMFVSAEYFCSNICDNLFTLYKREEDATMNSGKLDEELSRLSSIIDNITLNSIVLFNESFAATNEREGSEIAKQIITALLEKHIKVYYVSHLYDFTHNLYNRRYNNVKFLRAERNTDGTRTFKIHEGEPLLTSYGVDLYNSIFI